MKRALVAGESGVSGRGLVHHLDALSDRETTGLSRRSPDFETLGEHLAASCGILQDFFASPQRLPLAQIMSDNGSLGSDSQVIRPAQALLQEAASWPFAEVIFNLEYDVMSDTTRARRFGFCEAVDNEEMLLRFMTQLQKMRFISGMKTVMFSNSLRKARSRF